MDATFTAQFEGCRLVAYQDGGGIWTIGYGHTKNVHEGDTCTLEQAKTWLSDELEDAAEHVKRVCDKTLSANQLQACADFVYNVGAGAFDKSTLLRYLNMGYTTQAANEFLRWNKIGSEVSTGLARRRQAEKGLFLQV